MNSLTDPGASSNNPPRWRVGHLGRDRMYYEEQQGRAWQRINLDGEMLTGRAHHVIYFSSAATWQRYPEWAWERRDEIIARIKSEFREPDYEYQGDGSQPSSLQPSIPAIGVPRATKPARSLNSSLGLLLVATILLGVTGWMSWLVKGGLDTGETPLPLKQATLRRVVSRQQEPALFYVSVSIYSAIGLSTFVLAVWSLKEAFQPRA